MAARKQDRLDPYDAPSRVWCADFKGNFAVGGERCNPLTISDGFSRYPLMCKALRSTTCAPRMRSFEAVFCEHGLPDAIRKDGESVRPQTTRCYRA